VTNKMLQAAHEYAAAGYRVVVLHGLKGKSCTCVQGAACKGPGKHPRFKAWTKEATSDAAALTRLFTKYPNSNIGIMPQPGTVIVDIDPRHGGAVKGLHLPGRTPIQNTGGGGRHYIVRVDEDTPLPKLKGVDYRTPDRGQVVVSPSKHVSGGAYAWVDTLDFTTKPARWNTARVNGVERTTAPPAGTVAPELPPLDVKETLDAPLAMVEDWLQHAPPEDYTDWINVGQALKHAYGEDAFDMWDLWSARSDKYPGREELQRKWDTFDKNRDRALRTLRSIRHLAQRNGWRFTPPELEFSSNLWRTGLVADLVSTPAPALDWIIGNVLPRGKVCMLGGPGGAGKSFLMLVLAMQHAIGTTLLGADDFAPAAAASARKCMYFTAEDDRDDVHRRLHSIFDAYTMTDELRQEVGQSLSVRCTRGEDWRLVEEVGGQLVASKAADLIIEKLRNELGLSLLMFDPSVMFAGVEENDNAAAAVYMRVLDRIARSLNCAVLVGTHTNKGALASDALDQSAIRGASAFVDNARGSWLLRGMTENEAAEHAVPLTDRYRFARLQVVKNNYGPQGAQVWLERVGGGALRATTLATLNSVGTGGTVSGAMPPLATGGTTGQRKRVSVRAAAMQAHALEVLRYLDASADPVIGGAAMPLRTLGRELWSADATLTSNGMLDRTRRVLDYCEGQNWLRVQRPDEEQRAAHATNTYIVTPLGREQING
jgi:KaiC/GvpD/RAD55 family RecA-like ATPase